MANLWRRMTELYGHKFTSAYGDEPNDTWARALSHATGRQIANGLQACFKREDNWPPTLPEFVEMCRPRSLPPEHKSLPKPRADKDTAKKHIKQIRESLQRCGYERDFETD